MAPDVRSIFNRLMASVSFDDISTAHGFNRVGLLVDISGDLRREDGNARALAWCDELAARRLSARQAMLLEYFRAKIGEPWRVGRDERLHGIERQKDGERGERDALASVDRMVTLDLCRTLIDIT